MRELTYDYNKQGKWSAEPAPFVDIALSAVLDDPNPMKLSAQIYSVADASAVPISILTQLGARRQNNRMMSGMSGIPRSVRSYEVYVTFAGVQISVDVLESELEEVLIGRDILNRFTVELHGLDRITIIPVYD